jgi:transcriptional regulator with XRE-family HTH domain
VDNSQDLREILSQNIKTIRNTLHISRAKLAEHANISLSYLTDIERCRTWVSHKTLQSLARVLNREAWELLFPADSLATEQKASHAQRSNMRHVAELIVKKRKTLCRTINQTMEDLIMEITQEK